MAKKDASGKAKAPEKPELENQPGNGQGETQTPPPGGDKPATEGDDKPAAQNSEAQAKPAKLESIEALADRHRVPAWQGAALTRLTGWASGKQVTDKEYKDALAKLKGRRIGG